MYTLTCTACRALVASAKRVTQALLAGGDDHLGLAIEGEGHRHLSGRGGNARGADPDRLVAVGIAQAHP